MSQAQLLEKIYELLNSYDYDNALIAQELIRINFPEWFKELKLEKLHIMGPYISYTYQNIDESQCYVSQQGIFTINYNELLDKI